MKKYVASKFSDGAADAASNEAIDPLAAMGFKGKAASPRRAASAAAGAGDGRDASPRRAAAAARASTPSTPQPAGVTSASPSGRPVSHSRLARAYSC
jgi:hypothetical protein